MKTWGGQPWGQRTAGVPGRGKGRGYTQGAQPVTWVVSLEGPPRVLDSCALGSTGRFHICPLLG